LPSAPVWPGAPFIDIELGRAVGTLTTWYAIAHALGASVSDLLSRLCVGHEPPSSTRRRLTSLLFFEAGSLQSKEHPEANAAVDIANLGPHEGVPA
jgi:hypothetical protein